MPPPRREEQHVPRRERRARSMRDDRLLEPPPFRIRLARGARFASVCGEDVDAGRVAQLWVHMVLSRIVAF